MHSATPTFTMPSQIAPYFQNQTIFLTGGTGFLGKVLLEKLLRKCNVGGIYLLMRPKKGVSREERFRLLFDTPCFTRLRSEQPNGEYLSKVHLISGDCSEPSLGMNAADVQLLISNVTMVIHAAANVKFDQTLREAASYLTATCEMVRLAKQMPHLTSFLYISTAYSNCIRQHIEEKIYPPPMESDKFLDLINALDEDTLKAITPKILGEWPNTYVYIKCIIEDMLSKECDNLPLTIIRPAIVICAVKEPIPGWIDNFYGPVGIIFAAALGVLRSLHADPEAKAQVVPVDYVANVILAAAWARRDQKQLKIYNYPGNLKKKVTWGTFMKTVEPSCWKMASEKPVWYYSFEMRKNKLWHDICVFFLHTCFAHVADLVLRCIGREPIAVQNYARLDKMMKLISFFCTRSWTIDDDNYRELMKQLNDDDRRLFDFDGDNVIWEVYADNSATGGRVYLLKDPLETIPKGKKHMARLKVLHYTSIAIFWVLVYLLLRFVVSIFW